MGLLGRLARFWMAGKDAYHRSSKHLGMVHPGLHMVNLFLTVGMVHWKSEVVANGRSRDVQPEQETMVLEPAKIVRRDFRWKVIGRQLGPFQPETRTIIDKIKHRQFGRIALKDAPVTIGCQAELELGRPVPFHRFDPHAVVGCTGDHGRGQAQ